MRCPLLSLFFLLSLFLPPATAAERVVAPAGDLGGHASFYEQLVDADGFPILASGRVSPFALLEAAYLIDHMLAGRDDLRAALTRSGTQFVVMAHDELTTDVPEHADLRPASYWDKRARGLGATAIRPAVSCGEENLLGYPGDPYASENILVHEFGHAIHEMGIAEVDPGFDGRLQEAFRSAMAEGLWRGTYAATNHKEYFAEGVQSWFDTNRSDDSQHNGVDTRAELVEHDPRLAALLAEVFPNNDWRYVHPRDRNVPAHLTGYDPATAPHFAWPATLSRWYRAEMVRRRERERREGESELEHLHRRAEGGDASAMVSLGWRAREGLDGEASDREAVRWYRAAAALSDPAGLDSLGWMLSEGRVKDADPAEARDEAMRLLRLSANQGHAQGMFNLGRLLLQSSSDDPTGADGRRDEIEALGWLTLAAHRHHRGARGLLERATPEASDEALRAASEFADAWRLPHPRQLRVLTYNIHHGAGTEGALDLGRLARTIQLASPDLVALQEVDVRTRRTGGVDQLAELAKQTGMHGVFGRAMDFAGGGYGVAVLSRFPIVHHETFELPASDDREPRAALEVHVRLEDFGEEVVLFATHLDHHRDPTDRLAQAARLQTLAAQREGLVLVAGDLNATPDSQPIRILTEALAIADAAGDPTYPAGSPDRKIDYVLHTGDRGWLVTSASVVNEPKASDHRPLLVTFRR